MAIIYKNVLIIIFKNKYIKFTFSCKTPKESVYIE